MQNTVGYRSSSMHSEASPSTTIDSQEKNLKVLLCTFIFYV